MEYSNAESLELSIYHQESFDLVPTRSVYKIPAPHLEKTHSQPEIPQTETPTEQVETKVKKRRWFATLFCCCNPKSSHLEHAKDDKKHVAFAQTVK